MTADEWNERHPIGTPVRVDLTPHAALDTHTETEAWSLEDGTGVVIVLGVPWPITLTHVETPPIG